MKSPEDGLLDEMEKDALQQAPPEDALEKIVKLCEDQKQIEDRMEDLKSDLEFYQTQWRDIAEVQLPELLNDIGLTSLSLSDGSVVNMKQSIKASIPEKKKPFAFQWLREHGFGGLIKEKVVEEKVHPATLKAFANEQYRKGVELPSKGFSVFIYNVANIKRST